MTLSQIRNQVEALCIKYAAELEVYRLRSVAQEFCDDMAEAATRPEQAPPMDLMEWTQVFFQRMTAGRFRPRNLLSLYDYLGICLDRRILPQANDLLRSILPAAARRGLIPRSQLSIPF